MKISTFKLTTLIAASVVMLSAAPVLAVSGKDTGGNRQDDRPGVMVKSLRPSASPVSKEDRLEGQRLRVCETHQEAIQTRTESLLKLSTNMFEKFGSIFTRVDEYYKGSGMTLAKYDELVAAVKEKKMAAEETMTQAQNEVATFKCDGADPKGNLSRFRTHMQAHIRAMNEYKTSVRNFIVGVRSESGKLKSSATPTRSPKSSGRPNIYKGNQ